jgi:uncharacterized damage-inducible protein DinB
MIETAYIKETTQMNLAFLIKDYAAYNLWANKKIIAWLKTKPAELVERIVPSSFPSLRLTLVHIWDVERSWLGNLLQVQNECNYGKDYDGTLDEVFDAVIQQSEALAAYVQSLTENSLQEGCRFMVPIRWPEWDEFIRPRFEIIQHCLTHSAYHRGQVITIARTAGLTDAPNTDFMSYMLLGK